MDEQVYSLWFGGNDVFEPEWLKDKSGMILLMTKKDATTFMKTLRNEDETIEVKKYDGNKPTRLYTFAGKTAVPAKAESG